MTMLMGDILETDKSGKNVNSNLFLIIFSQFVAVELRSSLVVRTLARGKYRRDTLLGGVYVK